MSKRGREFVNDWVANHLPDSAAGDPVAASDVADQMMKAAVEAGIVPDEINEEVGSVFEVLFEAMRHRESIRSHFGQPQT